MTDYHADDTRYDSRCRCERICMANLRAADEIIQEAAAKDAEFARALDEALKSLKKPTT